MRHRTLFLSLLCVALPAWSTEPAEPPLAESSAEPSFDALVEANQDLTGADLIESLEVRSYQKKLDFDPKNAADFKAVNEALQLTPSELQHLSRDGFAIVDHSQPYSFGSMYYAIYTRDLPVLVTSDSVLHAMHRTFDDILMELETHALAPTIDGVLNKAHAALAVEAGKRGEAPDYFLDVDVYLTVARNLLAGAAVPNEADDGETWNGKLLVMSELGQDAIVLERLQQIRELKMQTPETSATDFFGQPRMVDYTQFRPRGHYSKSWDLKRYFRAMMWLGRADCGFELQYDRQVAGSALLSLLLAQSGGEDDLSEMDTLIGWLVGASDNLGSEAMLDVLQTQGMGIDALEDPKRIRQLRDSLEGEQKIRSQVVVSNPNDTVQVTPPQLFQLFGQRFVMDSFVLSKVVFDSIIFKQNKVRRMMPSGLDVAAALGNDEAVRLLGPELEAYPYAANLQASRQWVDGQPAGVWTDSTYNTWLDALRTLDDDLTQVPNAPQAMKTEAWQRKQLQTQLASWAELRHDTILYAKQSYTAWPGCEYPAGYVEPYPRLYATVARVAESTADAISAVQFDSASHPEGVKQVQQHQVAFLRSSVKTLKTLETLAQKELDGRPFSPGERTFLKKTIDARGAGSGPPRYDGWYPELFYRGGTRASESAPEVADVHTNPVTGKVLEVGTGEVDFIVAAIDNEGDTRIYVGPTYSYHEFEWPAGDRLTDQAWAGVLRSADPPARPDWMQPILSEPKRRGLPR